MGLIFLSQVLDNSEVLDNAGHLVVVSHTRAVVADASVRHG